MDSAKLEKLILKDNVDEMKKYLEGKEGHPNATVIVDMGNQSNKNFIILEYALLKSCWESVRAIIGAKPDFSLLTIPLKLSDCPKDIDDILVKNGILKPLYNIETIFVSYGMTLNIGNYESFRCDAGVTIRAKRDNAEYHKMYEEAWEIVSSELRAQVTAVREKMDAKKKGKG